tara:strand:- start:796 stop:1299 length:504 start_codon:yes stop_codon:yes gene_type:complete
MELKKLSSKEEYRLCVVAMIVGPLNKVLWCRRIEHDGWQFPQGGIDQGESPLEAVLRETKEEVGLQEEDIDIVFEAKDWFKYDVPRDKRPKYFRKNVYKGQKQKWFLVKLLSDDTKINLHASRPMEFDKWIWSTYWYPLHTIVPFKKEVYRQALIHLLPEYNKLISK